MQLQEGEKIVSCVSRGSATDDPYCSECGQVCYRVITISGAAGQSRNVALCGKHFMEALRDYPEIRSPLKLRRASQDS
jgi:hypothetical protein